MTIWFGQKSIDKLRYKCIFFILYLSYFFDKKECDCAIMDNFTILNNEKYSFAIRMLVR